jgi:hypothetical protein
MENIEIINLHRARNFSRKMNATFEFLKQNFKPLFKSLVYIAGPSILIVCVLMGSVIGDMFKLFVSAVSNDDVIENYFTSPLFWAQVVLVILFIFVGTVMTLSTMNNYIILYDEKKTNKIEVSEVWERVRSSFWMYVGTTVLFYLVMMMILGVLMIPMIFFAMASPVLSFLGMLIFYAGLIYFFIGSSLTFFIRSYEGKGFVQAMVRSFKLIKDNWWSTFGLLMIINFVMSSIAGVLIIPYYIVLIMEVLHKTEVGGGATSFSDGFQWATIIFFTFYYAINLMLHSIPNIGIAFQYFNLVELKEARGLITEIESFGQVAKTSETEEHY